MLSEQVLISGLRPVLNCVAMLTYQPISGMKNFVKVYGPPKKLTNYWYRI